VREDLRVVELGNKPAFDVLDQVVTSMTGM
jgi:hypothetical protein